MNKINQIVIPTLFLLLIGSCVSYDSLRNFNEPPGIPDQAQDIDNFKPILIQENDLLEIRISSPDPSAVAPFTPAIGGSDEGSGASRYLVNSRGEVNFPTLGRVKLIGLQTEAVADTLLQLLQPYFEQAPIIDVTLVNFKINVNGEVRNPGIFFIQNERVTILDALSLAGDFTNFSRRDSILIIREMDGSRSFGHIDLNSSNAFTSPYFYLQQNDVVYVQPDKTKTNSVRTSATQALPWITAIVSVTTAVIISVTRFR